MTFEEFKALKPGDRVFLLDRGDYPNPYGTLLSIDRDGDWIVSMDEFNDSSHSCDGMTPEGYGRYLVRGCFELWDRVPTLQEQLSKLWSNAL